MKLKYFYLYMKAEGVDFICLNRRRQLEYWKFERYHFPFYKYLNLNFPGKSIHFRNFYLLFTKILDFKYYIISLLNYNGKGKTQLQKYHETNTQDHSTPN